MKESSIKNQSAYHSKVILALVIIVLHFSSCSEAKRTAPKSEKENHVWSNGLINAYRALDEDRNTASADLLLEATENMPNKNWENYFVCATIYAPNGETDKAFDALDKAIESGLRDSQLLNSIPELSNLYDNPRWKTVIEKTENKRGEYLRKIESPEVLELLENLWAEDQRVLTQYNEQIALLDSTVTDEDYDRLFEPIEKRWDINKIKLDSIIQIYGWPGNRLVGEDGAKISWGIPQHHPNVFFKQKCLSKIKEAVEKGDMDPNHYAELNDRIARETWQKQTYGASMGQNAPYPIANPSEVNQRRFELGLLEPVEVYAYYHGITYVAPFEEEAKLEAKTNFEEAQSNYAKFGKFIKAKEIDSALFALKKSIKHYGDLNNEQLYKAALTLSAQSEERAKNLSLRILKVLIWRKWEERFDYIQKSNFTEIDEDDWNTIIKLLEQSKVKIV
ncbi:DUF6624 domain-containing protein [Flagellimonas flava]|uniref:DUF6624 domain-containing protein n=1 Tax=Flagellimonas TaxID=444459 RepID=UPI003D654B28